MLVTYLARLLIIIALGLGLFTAWKSYSSKHTLDKIITRELSIIKAKPKLIANGAFWSVFEVKKEGVICYVLSGPYKGGIHCLK